MGMGECTEEVDCESEESDEQPSAVTVRAVERDLADDGFRRTASECHEDDCEGQLWYDRNSLVCSTCWTIVDLERRRRSISIKDPWERFREARPTYRNSGRPRKPGGFRAPYDWKTTDDVDGSILNLEAEDFYR